MLIAPKRLKIQTSNLASMLPSKSWHHDMTTENFSEREHGKGHVTATTVSCKLQQWDRYRVPQDVFLLNLICADNAQNINFNAAPHWNRFDSRIWRHITRRK